ncbi:MAG: glycoside hydrolase family 15 protein [Gemmatimonadetes bacterium]|nr:glycoside hydrolase family 15 protein [Gemmatimonadota bacterium]
MEAAPSPDVAPAAAAPSPSGTGAARIAAPSLEVSTERERSPDYKPISAYGIIGDMRTAALVGTDGSIDWCCFPRFDSASLFAAILDHARGGRFRVTPTASYTSQQRYLPATNILVTAFHTDQGGVIELTDFMPALEPGHELSAYHEIHRRLHCTRGRVEVEIELQPRFGYALSPVGLFPRRNGLLATDLEDEAVAVASLQDLWWQLDEGNARAHAILRMSAGDTAWVVLRYDDDEVHPIAAYDSQRKLDATALHWDRWVGRIRYHGPYRAEVERSALALKLLFYAPTGGVVAAATTSLPEQIGGVRNWDYRYTWLRDASFTLNALHALGQHEEADRFMNYLKRVTRKSGEYLQIMYGLAGERDLRERTLDHLEGYRGSRPVRAGNSAFDQLQLDVYGEVLETAYRWHEKHPMTEGVWSVLARLADWVAGNWRRKDSSVWEVRTGQQHYVFSKVMCWVALDRATRMAERLGLPGDLERWRREREAIHTEVMEQGWHAGKQSFVQYYGTEALDAANLLVPAVGFLPPTHPRVKGTIEATLRELTSEDQELVYRYRNPDGLPGGEGVFSICTFWLADALILAGDAERGERIFRRMLRHANHLGLYSEEIDAYTGEFLGNFPQAFTHIALINTAQLLEWAHGRT